VPSPGGLLSVLAPLPPADGSKPIRPHAHSSTSARWRGMAGTYQDRPIVRTRKLQGRFCEGVPMRFIVLVKASKESESGVMPDKKDLEEMGKFNEELVNAGMMLAGEGLHPSAKGARIHFSDGKPTVIDGPFTETKELVAGYWLLQAKSRAEVVDWMKRAPFKEGEIEIRQVFEDEEFAYAPEVMEREKQLRARIAENQRH
jgi:hypothetical protein